MTIIAATARFALVPAMAAGLAACTAAAPVPRETVNGLYDNGYAAAMKGDAGGARA